MLIDHVMARCHKLSERLIRWFWFYNYSTTHLWYNTVWVVGPKTVLHIGYETDDVHNIAFLNSVIHMVLIIHKNIRKARLEYKVMLLFIGYWMAYYGKTTLTLFSKNCIKRPSEIDESAHSFLFESRLYHLSSFYKI